MSGMSAVLKPTSMGRSQDSILHPDFKHRLSQPIYPGVLRFVPAGSQPRNISHQSHCLESSGNGAMMEGHARITLELGIRELHLVCDVHLDFSHLQFPNLRIEETSPE